MKTSNQTLLATLAGIALLVPAGPARAQLKTAGDTTLASPKQRQFHAERIGVAAPSAPAINTSMSCAQCQDVYISRKDMTARGANKPKILVQQHLCESCETHWTVTGEGKARQAIATHECASGGAGSLSGCGTAKPSESTVPAAEK